MPQNPIPPAIGGSWSTVFDWPIIGLHSILTPDNKVLTYGTDTYGNQGGTLVYDVWDPVTNTHETLANRTPTDIFCSASIIIPATGEILISGGDGRPHGMVNHGVADVNVFDYRSESLAPLTNGVLNYERWYPTVVELASGKILILGGRNMELAGVGTPELYTPGGGWKALNGAFSQSIATDSYYPRAWLAPNGTVVAFNADSYANKHADVMVIDPSGDGAIRILGKLPFTTDWTMPAVKFAEGKVLILDDQGGSWVLDLNGTVPTFTRSGNVGEIRHWGNLVTLADGTILASGGSDVANVLTNVHNDVAIWDPRTGNWTHGEDASVARLYHSTTLLLPDATVLSLGGGAPGPLVNLNGEIYKPAYLFNADGTLADRPQIIGGPAEINQHQAFTITVDNAADISRLTFVHSGATTHSLDMSTSLIELKFVRGAGNTLVVTPPTNSNVLVPGHWLLFAFNNDGTPSIAKTIDVGLGGEVYARGMHGFATLSGSAVYEPGGDAFFLSGTVPNKIGAAMANERLDLDANFNLTFNAFLGTKDNGGNGIAFVLHNDPSGADAFGTGGDALGAGGIKNGLALALDTFQNKGDLPNDHGEIFDTDGAVGARLTPQTALPNLENGGWHTVRVTWDAPTQRLSYFVDGKQAGTLAGDLVSKYFGGSHYVHFGFTGATDTLTNVQRVHVTSLNGTYAPPDAPINPVVDSFGGALSQNGSAGYNAVTDVVTLTPDARVQAGSAFSETQIDLEHAFSIDFNFFVGGKDSGGDGIAFVLQNDARGANALGSAGVGLGATKIKHGLGIEFDTHQDVGDVAPDHTNFFNTDRPVASNKVTNSFALPSFENSRWHNAQVSWDPTTHTLKYSVDGMLRGSLTGDLATKYFGNSDFVHFGFTGGTGYAGNLQQVRVQELHGISATDRVISHGAYEICDCKPLLLAEDADMVRLAGSAKEMANNVYNLTANQNNAVGAVMIDGGFHLDDNFTIAFRFNLGPQRVGGEGFAFVLHNDPTGADALGRSGYGLGAYGIKNGIGLEFDTKQDNGDIAADHSNFFDTDTVMAKSRLTDDVTYNNLTDGKWHVSRVTWDADTQRLMYWVDGKLGGVLTGDLATKYFGGSDEVHFGFTAATGAGGAVAGNLQRFQVIDLDGTVYGRENDHDGGGAAHNEFAHA